MQVVLTLLGLCGAISASVALFPVVAQDFEDQDGFDPLDPMELVVEFAADLEPFSNPASELNLSVENELDQESTENRNVNAVLTPVAVLPEPKLKLVPDVVRVIKW